MNGRKISFLAASIAMTCLATTVAIPAASGAPAFPEVDAETGPTVTDVALFRDHSWA